MSLFNVIQTTVSLTGMAAMHFKSVEAYCCCATIWNKMFSFVITQCVIGHPFPLYPCELKSLFVLMFVSFFNCICEIKKILINMMGRSDVTGKGRQSRDIANINILKSIFYCKNVFGFYKIWSSAFYIPTTKEHMCVCCPQEVMLLLVLLWVRLIIKLSINLNWFLCRGEYLASWSLDWIWMWFCTWMWILSHSFWFQHCETRSGVQV